MPDDLRDVFGFAAAWRADPAVPKRLFSKIPEDLIPIYCAGCDRRWAVRRDSDPRHPPDLALITYPCWECQGFETDAPVDVAQVWVDAEGYPVEPVARQN